MIEPVGKVETAREAIARQALSQPAQPFQPAPVSWRTSVGGLLAVLVPVAIWFAPLRLNPAAQQALAVASFMILAWITEALDHAVTGLIGCYLFWALGVVKFGTAFSGFANDTTWFLFGAMLFGMMATRSGLARRLAYLVILRFGATYSRILLGLIVSDFLLTFLVPSSLARIVVMAAIAIGLLEAFGLGRGSQVGRGMFVILTYTANIFDKMMIGGVPSILARGLIEKVAHVEVLWSRWFFAYLPCSILTILVSWRLVLRLFPPEREALPGGTAFIRDELGKMGSWTALEKRSLGLMLIAIGFWMTDFLHHLSPALVALGIGLFALLPRVGVLEVEDLKGLNYLPVFFVASAISMGEVLVATRALDVLTNVMLAWMAPLLTNIYRSTFVLYWTAFVYHFFLASETSMLGTSIPVLMNFAISHHFNPLQFGLIWTFASGGKLFLYQSAVLIVGYSYGYFQSRDLLRVGAWLTLVEGAILMVLVPWYWPLIGIG